MNYFKVLEKVKELAEQGGMINLRKAIDTVTKERVNALRGKKLTFTWEVTRRAAKAQKWICPACGLEMEHNRYSMHGDHLNPNLTVAQGLNKPANCQALHIKCNLKKGSKSMYAVAKESGRSILDQLERK